MNLWLYEHFLTRKRSNVSVEAFRLAYMHSCLKAQTGWRRRVVRSMPEYARRQAAFVLYRKPQWRVLQAEGVV